MSKYLELKEKIKGPVYSVVTPFLDNENDDIDYDSLKKYLEDATAAGAKIFYVMGYNSRFSQLSFDEIKELNAFVVKEAKAINKDTLVIVADPLHCTTKVSIEFTKHAEEIGADCISLIFREKYFSDNQVYSHFKMVADASPMPILIHEMQFLSGFNGSNMDWPMSLLEKLYTIENIVALKEDSKNDDVTREVIERFKDRWAIVLAGGGKNRWRQFYEMGCESWLNGIGVFEPGLASVFWDAIQKGDTETTNFIIDKIEKPFFEQCVSKFGWHMACKSALEARGRMSRYERMPMLGLPEDDYQHVKRVVDELPMSEVLK
ncbi:MAG: dihydrodipicolinate synthase family protein [Bdellovibrionales bacterium]|nr:dihydrodipicolinate synthase family protein [Bdellovibrionales bacterium]